MTTGLELICVGFLFLINLKQKKLNFLKTLLKHKNKPHLNSKNLTTKNLTTDVREEDCTQITSTSLGIKI
jgi:hypothetical protein